MKHSSNNRSSTGLLGHCTPSDTFMLTRSRKIRWESLATCDAPEYTVLFSVATPGQSGPLISQLVSTLFPSHLSSQPFRYISSVRGVVVDFPAAWSALHSFRIPPTTNIPIFHRSSIPLTGFLEICAVIIAHQVPVKCLVVLSKTSGHILPPSPPRRTLNGHSLSLCSPYPSLSIFDETRVRYSHYSSYP